ncbi:hypothetical protein CWI38_2563p0010, partial [Hamiltosporidium tvaerminnensis]
MSLIEEIERFQKVIKKRLNNSETYSYEEMEVVLTKWKNFEHLNGEIDRILSSVRYVSFDESFGSVQPKEFEIYANLLQYDDVDKNKFPIILNSSTLSAMTGEAKEFLEVIGLEINKEKSATNDTCCEDTATLLEGVSVYKYLGIIEDSRGIPTRSSFEEVQSKLISRVERLCHTRLNAKNLFSAINQHAISLINYHIGVLRLEPADFSKLDDAVRAVLVKNKIHLR